MHTENYVLQLEQAFEYKKRLFKLLFFGDDACFKNAFIDDEAMTKCIKHQTEREKNVKSNFQLSLSISTRVKIKGDVCVGVKS